MIQFDLDKCNQCGLCADLCHESCITLTGTGPQIDETQCSTCTQCIAACPSRALSWNGEAPLAFDRSRLPSAEQLDELFKQRRSIRRFKSKGIPRPLLEEIAGYGVYAPTHAFNLRLILIDEPELIAALDQAVTGYCRWIYLLAYRFKIGGILAGLLGYADEMRKARPKIENTLELGHAFHSTPVAFILVVGDKKAALAEVSAQYALANMMYYAMIKGVGACLWANGPIFIDKHRPSRQRLGLQKDERIFGAMYLGFPAVRFSNKVMGKSLPVQWNGAAA